MSACDYVCDGGMDGVTHVGEQHDMDDITFSRASCGTSSTTWRDRTLGGGQRNSRVLVGDGAHKEINLYRRGVAKWT